MSLIGNTALRLDEEQAMLLDYARNFCRDRGGVAAVWAQLESEQEYTPELWEEMVAMGWTGIGLPESAGGAGLGIGAAVPVLESMGRALMGTPLLSSLLAAQLLLRADAEAAAGTLAALAAGAAASVAELESEDWGSAGVDTHIDSAGLLRGQKRLVMDAQHARWLVVLATQDDRPVLALVDTDRLAPGALTPRVLIDNTHRAADVALDGVMPALVIDKPGVESALRDYRLLGAMLVAAECAGATAACLDTTVDYLKTRKQFGKLIGSYQALKHPSVEVLTAMDAARSFVYHAATLVGDAALPEKAPLLEQSPQSEHAPLDRDAEVACRMAKAQATEALKFAGDRAVQFHGGMGFTWDCDAQLFLRRAQWAQQQFGDAQHHRQRLATLLLDE